MRKPKSEPKRESVNAPIPDDVLEVIYKRGAILGRRIA